MKEYLGAKATIFKQFPIRVFSLNPVVERIIKKYSGKNKKLLDVGCGDGFFCQKSIKNGFDYSGIDFSKSLLKKAKDLNPLGNFTFADARKFSHLFSKNFDLILNVMLLPVFKSKRDLDKNIRDCRKVLKKDGVIIVAVGHPCFDSYMQYGQNGRKDVLTKYQGYFKSPQPYTVIKKTERGIFEFHDNHWTLGDYFEAFKKAGLTVKNLHECRVSSKMKFFDKVVYERKKLFPTFLIFELVKI